MAITANSKVTAVTGKIIPLNSGTRLRIDPSTYSSVRGSYGPGDQVEVTEVIEYLENDQALTHVVKGDKWGKVVKINGAAVVQPSYMAIYYHGQGQICREEYTVVSPEPEPEPEPTVVYPEMILVGPSGKRQMYVPNGPAPEELQ